jgi:ubiquitin carboxyl-terminal hydrolase L3
MESSPFEWPPLESDPDIFDQYFKSIGLPYNINFEELYSLEYKELQTFTNPIIGVIVAIRRDKSVVKNENVIEWKDVPYFMKQTHKLDNACGLIAAIHCIGNNRHLFQLADGSILDIFYNKAETLNHEERAIMLENYEDFKQVHKELAKKGQSAVPQNQKDVSHHFVGFIHNEGKTIELDGTKKGPVIIKEKTQYENLLDDVIEDVKQRLQDKEIRDDISIIVLTYEYN